MMRCSNCDRDYPSDLRFCHQCGEALHALPRPDESPEALGEPIAPRQRVPAAIPRRRPPSRSSSPLFALLVLLAAGVGLVLVWHQWWMPALVRVSAKLPEPEAPRPIDQLTPRPAPEPEPTTPGAAPAPAPVSPPTSTGTVTMPTPPAATAPAATPAPAPAPAPAAEPIPRKAAPRPVPAPVEPVRPPPAIAKQTEPTPQGSGARLEPAAPSTSSGASARPELAPTPAPTAPITRVITLVPVGGGTGARAQIYWEFSHGGRLVVSGLAPPPPGRTYQLWLGSIKLGNRASGGLLMVDPQGEGTLRITAPRASWSPDIFGVTVERQGGAREPSDELILVGELTRQTPVAAREPGALSGGPAPRGSSTVPVIASAQGGAAAPLASSDARPESALPPAAGPSGPASSVPGSQPSAAVTAALPPSAPIRSPSALVRIVPVPVERAWTVSQSVLRSLGWDIERTDRAEGIIRTGPRNVEFKNVGVYATGTRHALDLSVRAVSETHTSISVKRELFEEQRIFWSRERTTLPLRDTAVEQAVLDAIEHLL
jgi:hypothetical protein